MVDGDTLLHTDVTPQNFLMTDDAASVVDWSMPGRGAAWVDTALMVVRLIRAGHDPGAAERWAEQVAAWAYASGRALTAFARTYAALTARRQAEAPAPHRGEIAEAAALWATARCAEGK